MKPARVHIAGLEFYGGDGEDGFYLDSEGLVGWYDGVDNRAERAQREDAHGDYDVPAYLDARLVVVRGLCLADDERRLDWYARRLTGLLAGGATGPITVDHAGAVLSATGRRSGKPDFRILMPGKIARYEFQLLCPDPRQYGEARRTQPIAPAVDAPVSHWGNFAASPLIEVYSTGGMPGGYSIVGPGGRRFTVALSGSSAFRHFIDMGTGQLLSESMQPLYGLTTRADTWAIPAGDAVVHRLEPVGGSGRMVVEVRDTYV